MPQMRENTMRCLRFYKKMHRLSLILKLEILMKNKRKREELFLNCSRNKPQKPLRISELSAQEIT